MSVETATMSTIEKGATVLVTGANGLYVSQSPPSLTPLADLAPSIANHVADQLLQRGYKVRGTVRSDAKAEGLHKVFAHYGPNAFTAVKVPDMAADGAFDDAVKGASGIVHVASVVNYSPIWDEIVTPTVQGATNLLSAAHKEPGVKSLVYTSSSLATWLPAPDTEIVITQDSWNDAAVQLARGPESSANAAYAASKVEAERAVWRFVEEKTPRFQVATVVPDMNFGRSLQADGPASSSASWAAGLYRGDTWVLSLPPFWFVDVIDDARLHVAALLDPSCAGQRIFAAAEPFNWNDLLRIFRKLRPGKAFMADVEMGRNLSRVPNQEAEALLRKWFGKGWTGLEESVGETIAGLE
ncbi:hypothetical protein LTR53_006856 [Teratosphaeriaceae sp. CCFEE 6253]|nr:hypothetical protein LTR53_006856 [Teratosphaeriaceae sp. CCFEE 6253]